MKEMKTLTLNGKTYDSFHDADARERLDELEQNGAVKTVNGIAPDENGNVEIPVSGGNVDQGGLTQAQISALDGMFKIAAYTADATDAYNAFKTAFGIGGEVEPDVPVVPDEPETEKTLTSISATYTGVDVAVGTAVTALTGIVVTAHYSDGSTATVTGYTLSGEIAEGSNTITVSYGGKTTTFTVTGVATAFSNETTWTSGVPYTYEAVENEYVETTGVITPYDYWNRTPYLYCKGASILRAVVNSPTTMLGNHNQYNCFYDDNKNFISAFSYAGIDYNTSGAYKDIPIPDNAAYFIASHKGGVIGHLPESSTHNSLGFTPYE